MSIPYVSPEQRRREHEEILAYIAREKAEKERQEREREAEQALRDELEWEGDLPAELMPKPFEDSLKASDFSDKSVSPFTKNGTPYQININHPAIKPLFDKYVREECKSVPPISDHERIYFEMRIIHKLDSLHVFKEDFERKLTDTEIRSMKYQQIRERERFW